MLFRSLKKKIIQLEDSLTSFKDKNSFGDNFAMDDARTKINSLERDKMLIMRRVHYLENQMKNSISAPAEIVLDNDQEDERPLLPESINQSRDEDQEPTPSPIPAPGNIIFSSFVDTSTHKDSSEAITEQELDEETMEDEDEEVTQMSAEKLVDKFQDLSRNASVKIGRAHV